MNWAESWPAKRIDPLRISIALLVTLMLLIETLLVPMISTNAALAIAIILGILLFALFFVAEDVAVFVLAAYALFHPITVAYFPTSLATGWKDFVLLAFFGLWLVRRLLTRTWVKSPLDGPVLAFIGAVAFSALRAPNLATATVGAKWYLNYVPLYFMAASLSFKKERLETLMWLLVIMATVSSLYGLGLLFGAAEVFRFTKYRTPGVDTSTFSAAQGVYALHWFSATAWATMVIMGLCLLNGYKSAAKKLATGFSIVIFFASTILSLTRSAWGTMAMGCLVVAFLRQKRILLYLLIGIVILLIVSPPYIRERAGSVFNPMDVSRYNKEQRQIPRGYQLIARNPLGYGLGVLTSTNYSHLIGSESVVDIGGLEVGLIDVGVEIGWLGLAAYAWVLLAAVRLGWKAFRSLSDPFLQWLVVGFTAFFFMVLVGEVYVEYLKTVESFFWLFLGILVSIRPGDSRK